MINKYKVALDLCSSNEELRNYTQLIRETLYRLLQPNYTATIDEVVWAECFINRDRFTVEEREDKIMMLRDFTKEDWYAYAGAEEFTDGTQPKIASKEVEDCEVTVIVSNSGVQIFILNENEECMVGYIEAERLSKRSKIAIGNDVCSLIDSCLSKDGLLTQLKEQLELKFY